MPDLRILKDSPRGVSDCSVRVLQNLLGLTTANKLTLRGTSISGCCGMIEMVWVLEGSVRRRPFGGVLQYTVYRRRDKAILLRVIKP